MAKLFQKKVKKDASVQNTVMGAELDDDTMDVATGGMDVDCTKKLSEKTWGHICYCTSEDSMCKHCGSHVVYVTEGDDGVHGTARCVTCGTTYEVNLSDLTQ